MIIRRDEHRPLLPILGFSDGAGAKGETLRMECIHSPAQVLTIMRLGAQRITAETLYPLLLSLRYCSTMLRVSYECIPSPKD